MKLPTRVLFVEDDPDMIAVYRENFLRPEFETGTAHNGKEALRLLRSSRIPFEVLVTDNCMPEMDGLTLLKITRVEFPELKVVIVTACTNGKEHIMARNLMVHKFIDKPVKMQDLKEVIRKLV